MLHERLVELVKHCRRIANARFHGVVSWLSCDGRHIRILANIAPAASVVENTLPWCGEPDLIPNPQFFAAQVAAMDALSEALRAVQVTSALFFNGEFSAPWRFVTAAQERIVSTLSPGSEHLVLFHLVTEGQASARAEGCDAVSLKAGDIVVFPNGDAHELWNGQGAKLFPSARLLPKLSRGELAQEKWGGGGQVTRIVCGYLSCERHAKSLFLSGLPAMFKVNVRGGAGSWIENAIRHLVGESEVARPGRPAVQSKLAESLFMETLCRYMDELPPERTGWLAGARDPVVGQALAHMHRDPVRPWTLPDLAQASRTSRTVLTERFTRLIGEPPAMYLSRWRLQLGARLLLATDMKVLRVASDVGYESEAAFNRAFKRIFGVPPARYRSAMRRGSRASRTGAWR